MMEVAKEYNVHLDSKKRVTNHLAKYSIDKKKWEIPHTQEEDDGSSKGV